MGGLVGIGEAGGAGGGADAGLIEEQEQRFRFDAGEGEVGGVGQALRRVAIALGGGKADEEFAFEVVAERLHGGGVGGEFGAGEFGGAAEADDAGDVLGAAAAVALLVFAVEVRREGRAFADEEGADAFRAAEFVGAEREVVDGERLEVERKLADGLHGIAVKAHAAARAEGGDVGDGEEDAGLVVGRHERDDGGVGREGGVERGGIEEAVAVGGQAGDAGAVFFEEDRVIEHGGMLDGGGDDMALGGIGEEGGEEGGVVALGGAAGEDDLAGGGAEQGGDVAAGSFDDALQRGAEGVPAARIAQRSVRNGRMVSNTSGRSGVVAL